jgi:hypothetical protein
MPRIHCELRAFNKPRATPQEVPTTPLRLLTCAATVGMSTLAWHPATSRSLLEMLWRIGMVAANVRPTASGGRWTRSSSYDRLDPSEKSAVSYFLGMTQAAFMSRYVLGYPHLVHVDLLLKQQGSSLSGNRPDFVAVNPTTHPTTAYSAVLEAKGRTNGFSQPALDGAKKQALKTPGVRGLVVGERVASESFFAENGSWSSVLEDPDGTGNELEFGLETYLLVYYRNIIEAGRQSDTWEQTGDHYQFSVPELHIVLSLPSPLVEAYDASAEIHENEARDDAAVIVRTYRDLVEASVDGDPGDLVAGSLAPGFVESDLLEVFGMQKPETAE